MEIDYLLIVSLLFVLSAFFSGSETAFFSLTRVYLKKLENSENRSAKLIISLVKRPRRLLITILLGNTFVNVAISSLMTYIVLEWQLNRLDKSLLLTIQVILTTFFLLIFGEILPKLIALSVAGPYCKTASLPIRIVQLVLLPVVWIIERLTNLISRKPASDKHVTAHLSAEELHNLIQSDSTQHNLEEHEKKMLAGLFRFHEAKLTEIYVPRVKVTAIEESQTLEELRDLIVRSGFSRIPVYRMSIDDIIGIVYVKDLLLYPEKNRITDLMRPAWFVTENMKVQNLLNQFKTKKMQMAIVVDEYGGTSGIISLEDILEEIVGEIHDEYDLDESPMISKMDDNTTKLTGECNIRTFNQEFDVEINPDEYDNIAEFLLSQFNHVPEIGETFVYDQKIKFEVLDSDSRSIKLVKIGLLS